MASADPYSLDGIDRIPDPAAHAARLPVPPAAPPAEPSPTRDARRRLARVVVAVACLWLGAAVAAFGVRADIGEPLVIAPLAVWALTVVLGLVFVLRPRARGLPAPVRAVQHAIWIVPVIYVAAVLAVGAAAGGPAFGWGTVRGCLGMAHLIAVGPLAAAALLLRRSFVSASAWRGAAVGALAGLAGSLGVHAHCPVPALDHLLAAHGPAILVGCLLGGILGRARGSA
ncbi:MAG: NrsF family protein [Minicystis sp.]